MLEPTAAHACVFRGWLVHTVLASGNVACLRGNDVAYSSLTVLVAMASI